MEVKFRLVWVPCPDCGRSGTNGGCFEVERRGWFWWSTAIAFHDRGGRLQAEHYPTEEAAMEALQNTLKPKPLPTVIKEFSI